MALPLAVILTVAILAGLALYAMLAARLYKRLRAELQRRGYKSPVVLTGFAVAAYLLPFVWIPLLKKITDEALPWFFLLFLATPLVLTLAVRILPARTPRTVGRRVVRFPYRHVGYILMGVAVVIWIAALVTNKPGLLSIGGAVGAAGVGCLAIARRAAAPDAAAMLAADQRPPVLYLRPFQQEEETFARLPWRWHEIWANAGRSIINRRRWLSLTLEEYLGTEVSARIGPFIALGNPRDFLPPEEGAARTYVADEEWAKHFEELVRGARCIVMIAAVSENVFWELAQIRSMGLQQKLFVLTKPKLSRTTVAVAWPPFADALQQTGYLPCREDPGPGAAVGFDGGGQAVMLNRDARSAAETVDALCNGVGLPLAAGPDNYGSSTGDPGRSTPASA